MSSLSNLTAFSSTRLWLTPITSFKSRRSSLCAQQQGVCSTAWQKVTLHTSWSVTTKKHATGRVLRRDFMEWQRACCSISCWWNANNTNYSIKGVWTSVFRLDLYHNTQFSLSSFCALLSLWRINRISAWLPKRLVPILNTSGAAPVHSHMKSKTRVSEIISQKFQMKLLTCYNLEQCLNA